MLAHVALPSCQTEGGYWAGERGLLSTAQVQCGKYGVFDVFFLLGYIYIYILLLRYLSIAILHACRMGVLLSLYLYSIFVPYFDLYFSPNVRTTQTGILYSVTSKRQPLISDTFLVSKQINDAEVKPLSLPPFARGSL